MAQSCQLIIVDDRQLVSKRCQVLQSSEIDNSQAPNDQVLYSLHGSNKIVSNLHVAIGDSCYIYKANS